MTQLCIWGVHFGCLSVCFGTVVNMLASPHLTCAGACILDAGVPASFSKAWKHKVKQGVEEDAGGPHLSCEGVCILDARVSASLVSYLGCGL